MDNWMDIVADIAVVIVKMFCVWIAWNFIMPELFGLPEIEFVHAIGLFILCQLLFGASMDVATYISTGDGSE